MKKLICVLLIALLVLTALAGCAGPANKGKDNGPSAPAANDKPANDKPSGSSGGAGSKNALSTSYTNFSEMKTKAYERHEELLTTNTDLAMLGMTFLPVLMMDLELIPLTVMDQDKLVAETALGILGFKDIKVGKSGNKHTITYATEEGKAFEYVAEYDAASDSVQAIMSDGTGNELLFFEYVKAGKGYACQYYSKDSGQVISLFFDENNITGYSIQDNAGKPASIFKNTSLNEDFIKKGENFLLIKDGKVLLHENGTEKTY